MSLFDNNLVQKEVPGIEASKAWMENKIIDVWKTYKSTHSEKSPEEFHKLLLSIWMPGPFSAYDKHISSGDIGATFTYVDKNSKGFYVHVEIFSSLTSASLTPGRDYIDVHLSY